MGILRRLIMRHRISFLAFVVCVLVTATAVSAQRWGRGRAPQTGVCFFEHENFEGRSFCLGPNETVASMPQDMRDAISSIRIMGRAEVTVFRDDGFRGPSAYLTTDAHNLTNDGWNDTISSIRVNTNRLGWNSRGPAWGRGAQQRPGACFYEHANYEGQYFCMPRGAAYSEVPAGFNDTVSSIRIFDSGVQIYVDGGFRGRSQRVTSDVPNLEGFWNDKMSSIRIF
jgi:hypothetical protein